MTPLRKRVEQWMREDQLKKGQLWYLVSTEWWTATFPPLQPKKTKNNYDRNGTDGDVTMDNATASSSTEDAKTTHAIRNTPLVDEAHSSKSSSCVVLIPRLAEQRDYLVVSRRVWELLSEEFGFDWTIFRMVVESGPNHTLRVEIYPPMFKFLYWRNGMEEPEIVNEVPATDRDYVSLGKPVVLVRSEAASIYDLHSWIRTKLLRRMRDFFPEVKSEDVETQVQVAYRVTDTAPWTALTDAIEKPKTEETTTINDLLLEPRDYKDGDERFHHLLIETRWRPLPSEPQYLRVGSVKRDWRFGRYYSAILAKQWRWQLEIGQLIDAMDTDKKWYEARVLDLDDDRVKVHFRGWTPKWDEWMPRMSDHMQQLHTRAPNWRAFKVGDGVQVGTPIVDRAYPEWRNATVVKVETVDASDEQEAGVRILVKDDVREKWVDAQDEMLCRPGTHKAVNAASVTSSTSTTTTTNLITARSSYSNKSRDYSYDYGRGKPDYPGVVGLQNLGNTCFMNSMLQCLNNAKPLKDYFLAKNELDGEPLFENDVNEDNPLGMKGMIAREFAKLVTRMWSNEYTTVSPTGLKSVIGKYAPQFAGYQQQDSQEVMNFILDGLHEDLNRVKKKPYTMPVERNGRGDDEVAQEEWAQYLLRNDSVIVENFMGQLRSHVTCSNPECTNESTTFDPFMSLSVPLPSDESVSVKVQLFWANGSIPMKYAVRVAKSATVREVKDKLSELCSVPLPRLVFVEVRDHRIKKIHRDLTAIEELTEDIVHAYELEFPFNEYELCSSNLRPLVASFASRHEPRKAMSLVALLHQAPVASPVDGRPDANDLLKDEGFGSAKQRRVEVELMNTPLLVSIDAGLSSEQVHDKVWQVVSRLVADDLQYDDKSLLPYRLHITNPNGASPLIHDFPNTSAFVELPDTKQADFCFTLEWRRMGPQLGYDERSAKRTEIHESMRRLTISSSPPDDAVTLVNCLTKFMEREQLGKTDTWYCPKCKEHVRAFKKFDLFALPKVLIFQLKRFRYAQSSFSMHRDKITTQVTFPIDNLDLSGFVVGPQRHGELVYDLFAVSEHSGGLGGGHYTAVGKNPENKKWYSYNDSFTKAADAEDAVTPRAYVLFYVRRE